MKKSLVLVTRLFKNWHQNVLIILAAGILSGMTSCKQDEGFGGTSSVTGKVYALDYNTELTELIGQYYATDEDVFIVFGDDIVYAEKTSTHYDGTYRFSDLKKGHYTVYAYSKDTTGNPDIDEFAVMQSFDITSNGQDVVVPDMIIVK